MRRRQIGFVLGPVAALALAAVAVAPSPAANPPAKPGWATGGSPADPLSQYVADARYAARECAPNTLLLFRVRGSGEVPGSRTNDHLGIWTRAAGEAAIRKGWRVRDLQADYEAPKLPLDEVVERLKNYDLIGVWKALAIYRDVAKVSWRNVRGTLVSAYERCKQRKIVVSGYSQGALVLRYVLPNLPGYVRAQIQHVDLVGDPTADKRVDGSLGHPAALGGRATDGMDTQAARVTHLGRFKQTRYPQYYEDKTSQFCLPNDPVCDFNPISFLRAGRNAHSRYQWANIGRAAVVNLRT